MSVFETLRDAFRASTESADHGAAGGTESKGAYWCHDCDERIPDADVTADGPPVCPSCEEAMTFERSPSSTGCAC
jgi:Zn finger protein HypA/HybF involved in hydrogenase expression